MEFYYHASESSHMLGYINQSNTLSILTEKDILKAYKRIKPWINNIHSHLCGSKPKIRKTYTLKPTIPSFLEGLECLTNQKGTTLSFDKCH